MAGAYREERRRQFRQDLNTLKEEGYLSAAITDEVARAHHQYHLDLMAEEKLEKEEVHTPIKQESVSVNKPIQKPQVVKKTLSPEELRERNITWSLNIGVILLLIGGLFVATSNWETMTPFMKSGAIAAVSALFFLLAFLSKKVLNIEKTGFAFTVLGSLFLPIFILSLGWFGLLGSYLSIQGEGKYFLGVLGSFVPAIAYLYFSTKLQSRLFVWFTYISISVGSAFLLAGFSLPLDYFYLGIMLFNGLVIYVYHWLKSRSQYTLFSKEMVHFSQINLVLSTLFMLFVYDNHILYSVNLLLTAVIYLSMMFVSGKKEFHFVFSAMIVYGVYQLIENSILDMAGPLIYALVAFGFMLLPNLLKDSFQLNKAFQYTSAVVSGLAFIYISLEGILMKMGEASFILMVAYFIIALNFIYLTNVHKKHLFMYLSSIFLFTAFFEGFALVDVNLMDIHYALQMFLAGFVLLLIVGTNKGAKLLEFIRNSSRDVSIGIMILAILLAELEESWLALGMMFGLFALSSFIILKVEKRKLYTQVAIWTIPVASGLTIASIGQYLHSYQRYLFQGFTEDIHLALASLFVFIMSFAWSKLGEQTISRASFLVANGFYLLSILASYILPTENDWIQPLILSGGILMFSLLYIRLRLQVVPFMISITTLLAYFSIWEAINETDKLEFIHYTGVGVLLFAVAFLFHEKEKYIYRAFSWTAHIFYPMALAFSILESFDKAEFNFLTAILIYAMSMKLSSKEWQKKIFLYAAFTSLFLTIATGLERLYFYFETPYAFLITSILILVLWLWSKDPFRKRIPYYYVPFSILGMSSFLIGFPKEGPDYLAFLLYTMIVLFHLQKVKWDIFTWIPLVLLWKVALEFTIYEGWSNQWSIALLAGLGILILFTGKLLYKHLIYKEAGKSLLNIDFYTVVSLLYFLCLYRFETEMLWTVPLPGLLISLAIWLQQNRVNPKWRIFVPVASIIFLLQPYYGLMMELELPELFEREIYVLPFVLVVIFIKKILKGSYEAFTSRLQWAILIIVALLLIQDGLASSTIYDAIILGTLSLTSMLAGMFIRVKSYFFVGAGVLLLNVFLQTRPFWGNMPWWAYLLIAGSILIGVASYNEWHKQKAVKGEPTLITKFKENVINKLKEWK
ncbi:MULTISPECIES: hypothetical protein [unclassified Bacillus (in: firmicutes)]|uniref:hypothetical protein n=1 Tax=unclassified Bacillus (in: firmicutes) TaxID=185979 RepID=UPI0008E5ED91|nr:MULTISPECIES: hypothetical protein [unclassified Bacillus (in: firmicutes)]SFA88232.1 hypothetical protein SAMN02799634_102302 [Bacillus sp. UNCCL13]SFQ84548.1 hypothetical protein SAMN04488577_2420 [Bacillus sp. cl95]